MRRREDGPVGRATRVRRLADAMLEDELTGDRSALLAVPVQSLGELDEAFDLYCSEALPGLDPREVERAAS